MKGRALALAAAILAAPLVSGCLAFHKGAMPGEPKDATFATVGDARVRYLDEGEGPPVVLIHGFASALDAWITVTPELKKKHRVLSMDLKGFGWTDRPEGDYSPAAQAKLVLDLMDQRGIKSAAIVAHSWGSSVALSLALQAPERVTKIALYDAWVYEDQLPSTFVMARAGGIGEILFGIFYDQRPDERIGLAFYDKRFITERLIEEIDQALERPGTEAAALAAVRGQRYTEMEQKYRTIEKPTLLLWGREDIVTRLKFGERLSRELPQAKLVVYPGCGHFPMIEARRASTAELVRFLDEEHPAPKAEPKPEPKEAREAPEPKAKGSKP